MKKKSPQGCFRKIIQHRSFPGYKAIYKEIEKFENRYRGRELPGFVNYKTFEIIIKQQIRELEEPAVDMLRTVTGEFLIWLFGVLFPGPGKAWIKTNESSPPWGVFQDPRTQSIL